MVFPKGRFAAVVLTGLLALPPTAALAQCQHSNPGMTGMPQMGMGMGRPMGGMMSRMSSMSPMCSMHHQASQTSQMSQMSPMCSMHQQTPSQQMQWFGLQQGQQLHLQQMQSMAMQQQMQLLSMQQSQLGLVQQIQPIAPSEFQAPQPRPKLTLKKEYGALQQQMEALQQRLTGLQQAAQRNELQAPQVGAVQNDVNAVQLQLDACPKAPSALLDQMNSLHRQTDELLDQITARPGNLIAALRTSR